MVVVNAARQQNSISLRHLKVTLTLLLLFFLIMIDQIKASFWKFYNTVLYYQIFPVRN